MQKTHKLNLIKRIGVYPSKYHGWGRNIIKQNYIAVTTLLYQLSSSVCISSFMGNNQIDDYFYKHCNHAIYTMKW